MTMQQQHTTTPDPETIERLSAGFAKVFETFDARADVFAPDAFFDLNMPVWRFQLEGASAFGSQIAAINQGPARIAVLRTVPTVSGFVTEHEERQVVNGEELSARRLWLCAVDHGVIVEAVGYCSGEWDEELRARHAAEVLMLRP